MFMSRTRLESSFAFIAVVTLSMRYSIQPSKPAPKTRAKSRKRT